MKLFKLVDVYFFGDMNWGNEKLWFYLPIFFGISVYIVTMCIVK